MKDCAAQKNETIFMIFVSAQALGCSLVTKVLSCKILGNYEI